MLTDGYHKAARALAPALRENATFTKAWFLAQANMKSSFWRALSVDGLRANDGYVAVGGDIAGKKRGHLLAIMPADEEGDGHLGRDERDRGTQAYRVTPFGKFRYR